MELTNVRLKGNGNYVALSGDKVIIDLSKLKVFRLVKECTARGVKGVLTYTYLSPHHFSTKQEIEKMIAMRENLYKEHTANLEDVLSAGCAFCRERSIFLHILLANLGISSCIRTGSDSEGNRHAFVIYQEKSSQIILDPMNSMEPCLPSVYEKYKIDLIDQQLVEPITLTP